jgi:predicted AAA+ superfamily ATPase
LESRPGGLEREPEPRLRDPGPLHFLIAISVLAADNSRMVITRDNHVREILKRLREFPVVAVLGARQVGKTTLARQVVSSGRAPRTAAYFDLESPEDLARLEDPMLALRSQRGLVVIDEVQRLPELFSILRVLADRKPRPARFLVLGSASPALLRQSSESLAGRISHYELGGLSPGEVGWKNLNQLWIRGGFPLAYLARTHRQSTEWRRELIQTFLERDLPQLGVTIPAATLRRFWTMLAHYHGQTWNSSAFASSFGVADTTVRRYLDLLASAFVAQILLPWSENLGKRQVKSPKIYLRDSGLLHTLLGLSTQRDVEGHPICGASWEGFALNAVVQRLGARPEECFFWATHAGAELDLVVIRGRMRFGFEFKRTVAPTVTRSMRTALEDLRLQRLDVIHAGERTFPLSGRIRALALRRADPDLARLS